MCAYVTQFDDSSVVVQMPSLLCSSRIHAAEHLDSLSRLSAR